MVYIDMRFYCGFGGEGFCLYLYGEREGGGRWMGRIERIRE
jgi:hypothetical protein